MSSEAGTIEAGKTADIIAVAGDPLADVRVLKSVEFVMARGEVIKAPGRPCRGRGTEAARAAARSPGLPR